MKTFTLQKNKGFSLIEIMVSLAVFSIVVLVAAGALLSIIDGSRKTQALKSVVNNLNFALEDMTRNLRVGGHFNCDTAGNPVNPALTHDCEGNQVTFDTGKRLPNSLDPANPITVYGAYRFVTPDPNSSVCPEGCIEATTDYLNPAKPFVRITAPEVHLTKVSFRVTGSSNSDTLQPKIVMIVQGYAGVNLRSKTYFNLQTTITQRIFDL